MGSVWLEEVDRAFLKLIPLTVKYKDEDSVYQVPEVFIRNPEREFRVKTFPSVTIYNYDQRFDPVRYHWEEVRLGVEEGIMTVEQPALPFNLFYQIDFWSEYQSDINDMSRLWLGKVLPRTTLEVVDTDGEVRNCVMELIDYVNIDHIDGDRRVFHRAYSYRIWVELDEGTPEYREVVTETDIRRSEDV